MHFTSSVALVAAVASVALASPVDIRDSIKKSKSFTVHQVPSTKKTKLQPVLQVAKTYAKFGKVLPVAVSKAAAAAQQTGTVAAVPEANDESYLCPVTVGGTVMNLDFDTGSADLWVYSTLQPWTQQSGHAVYSPNDGTSTMLSGDTWDITYGDGSTAEGVVYADTVVVGAVTATSQAVEAATSVSSAFMADVASDGLVGLAFSSINTVQPTQQTTFFDTVKSSLKAPVFTALLKKGAAGSYDFGVINSTKYTGAISYLPVTGSSGYWEINAGVWAVGSAAHGSVHVGTSIVDTGTSLLYLPNATVTSYYAKVAGAVYSSTQGGWIFPCSATLPNYRQWMNGVPFTLPGSYLNYASISSSYCFGGMQPNTGIGFSIYGDVFLKAVFVVFNQTQSTPHVGFAKQAS